eukprot:TRINITY_DN3923_c0_g2_i1.p1 TRINITY_DN3923_c0_g2~~TRINITY_DN3923_c0_g2_i1.p1  ORF type:complete len:354 (-),score=60.65 TRINITY_DN3923_c0_g2_i1:232-1293(-)
MLQVCNGGQTVSEYRAQFSTWAILASPLILGNDIAKMDEACKSIVLNKEVIAVNQDALVRRGRLVYQWPDPAWPGHDKHDDARRSYVPVPSIYGAVAMQKCDAARSDEQAFMYYPKDGTIRLRASGQCLSYLGYKEANLYMTECNDWTQTGVGGQTWSLRHNSIFVQNTTEKCLDVFNCDVSAPHAAQVCTCIPGGHWEDDCFAPGEARKTCEGRNLNWTFGFDANFEGSDRASTIATQVDGQRSCLTAAKLPSNWVNISLQVWARPLSDGSIAAVAFNRGGVPRDVDLTWSLLNLPPAERRRVRDLWAHGDLGVFSDRLRVRVEPHDVRALRFFPTSAEPLSTAPHATALLV